MSTLYFDSAATSIPCRQAVEAASAAIAFFGNPSSVHSEGLAAKKIIDSARKSVASALYCKPEEVVFTGCGSESNNQALFGLSKLRARRSKRIITTNSEHPSVSAPLASLEAEGFEIIRLSTKGGAIDISELESELQNGAAFVSIMLANNETGAKYDLASVRRAIDRSGCGALLHCDAVQGFLKTDDRREIAKYCDCASVSAHKIGGFKGVGALFVKNGLKMPPFIKGGGQESGFRSGTENTVGIAAFGAAAEAFNAEKLKHISELYEYTKQLILESGAEIKLNLPEKHICTILSVSVAGVRSEVMLNALSAEGICISAGSACSARKGPSGALEAFGLTKQEIEGTVRISFGADNTREECVMLAERLAVNAKRLKR
ncbi:MAG: aminotransferase class V-fold PLP-dependent enzyme [Clostridia bacterium]|nr:aminotransferase class V-fold PLP-dependent enzyme [Clostridia bacterium]